jgi:hypothetical protein
MYNFNTKKSASDIVNRHFGPMIIRKYNIITGWPLYVGIICGEDLSTLDDIVTTFTQYNLEKFSNDMQSLRDYVGHLSDTIVKHFNTKRFGCVEGVAVVAYADKTMFSSLYGDFMNHGMCRLEFFLLLNMMTSV